MIEFEVVVYDENNDAVNTYDLGRASLEMEIDNLPKGWYLKIRRVAEPKDKPSADAKPEDYISARSQ